MAEEVSGQSPHGRPTRYRTGFVRSESVVEAAAAADTVAVSAVFGTTAQEASASADTSSAPQIINASVDEAGSATDSQAWASPPEVTGIGPHRLPMRRRSDFSRAIGEVIESGSAQDSTNASLISFVADAGNAQDASNRTLGVFRSINEAISESGPLVDTSDAFGGFNEQVDEGGAASDEQSVSAIWSASVAEAGAGADLSDTVSLRTDANVSGVGPMGMPYRRYETFDRTTVASVEEFDVAAEAQNASLTADSGQSEAASATDEQDAASSSHTAEAGTADDQQSGTTFFTDAVQEIGAADDLQSTGAIFDVSVPEAAAADDSQAAPAISSDSNDESGSATDTSDATLIQIVQSVVESAAAQEAQNATGIFNAFLAEQAGAADSVFGLKEGEPEGRYYGGGLREDDVRKRWELLELLRKKKRRPIRPHIVYVRPEAQKIQASPVPPPAEPQTPTGAQEIAARGVAPKAGPIKPAIDSNLLLVLIADELTEE